jgi:hypothetical protein
MVSTNPNARIGQPAAAPDDATNAGAPAAGTGPLVMFDDDPGLDAAGWRALGVGFALAVCTQIFSFLEMLVGYFVVLVHEMGHAIAGWLFGYPSLPAFDFTYGGGVTSHACEQSLFIVFGVLAAVGALAWIFRGNRLTLSLLVSFAALYALLAFTPAHEGFIVAFGHGAELVFAFVFLQRAFTGNACALPAERPLYAWLGFHVVLHNVVFAWGLATSALARQQYGDAKGGGHWMDFSRLAREHLGVSLEVVAVGFLALSIATPVLAFAWSWLGPQRDALRSRLGEI